ncbi:NTP transferase domain-containing protein [Clostridium paraputrificum]|uniref:NTP transferase domain-containing protein n=1 Tax=Clostridium TaxID=1485 RepID=UPI003D339851
MIKSYIEVLKIINDNENITQRKIASDINISLGKVNTIINKMIDEKHIYTVKKNNRDVRYELTTNGVEILEKALEKIKSTKLEINKNHFNKVKQAVILAAGSTLDFNHPVGFLDVNGEKVIDRIVKLLEDNGIEKIIIVTGYKSKFYDEYVKTKKNIFCVYNNKYNSVGNMKSLALAQKYINDDFILIEHDLVFENIAVKKVLENSNRDCILLSDISGSGDEAYVEIKDGYLFKMSKDIHQFNRIDGEMIGISKISYRLFCKMLSDFKRNENQLMSYEYMILDISRNYNIGYEKITPLIWGEIDNINQYKNILNNIVPMINKKEAIDKK